MNDYLTIIGAGLAGSEAAWQAAERGIPVVLYEMRSIKNTAAHKTDNCAELVCSNSLGNNLPFSAPYILKEELRNLNSIVIKQGNFSNISKIVKESGINKVEAVLFDLGVSSLHLEKAVRGFSFRQDSTLDMRFDKNQINSATNVINEESEEKLKNIIREFGEEPKANAIARSIVRNRPIISTLKLADIIVRAKKSYKHKTKHPATQTFQAIRMYVNNELNNISLGIKEAINLLKKSGINTQLKQ